MIDDVFGLEDTRGPSGDLALQVLSRLSSKASRKSCPQRLLAEKMIDVIKGGLPAYVIHFSQKSQISNFCNIQLLDFLYTVAMYFSTLCRLRRIDFRTKRELYKKSNFIKNASRSSEISLLVI